MNVLAAFLLFLSVTMSSSRFPLSTVDIMANVTMLLNHELSTQCIQIFRPDIPNDYDNERIYLLWRSLARIETNTTTGIYTFSSYLQRKRLRQWKMTCYKGLKVILGDEGSKSGYITVTQKMRITDSVWLIFLDMDEMEFLGEADLLFDCEVIVAKIEAEDLIMFYEVYRVRKDYPLRSVYYGNWTRQGGLKVFTNSLYNRRSDLEGLVLKAGCIKNWPNTYLKNSTWVGFLPKVWSEIEEQTNSSTIYYESKDGFTGLVNENQTWNGLVGMVLSGEIDVIVSELTLEKTRSHVLDFYHPLISTTYQLYFRQKGFNLQWDSVFKPFGKQIWFSIIFWVMIGSVVLSICYYLSMIYGFEEDQEKLLRPGRSIFFILQTLTQQGYYNVPRSAACRILFFLAYAVSAILVPSYSASLISYLTQQVPYRPFNNLEEMHRDGTYQMLVKENSAEYSYFMHSQNVLLQDIFREQILTVPKEHMIENSAHAFHIICNYRDYAFFAIDIVISIRLGTILKTECPIIKMTSPVSAVLLTMGAAKNDPYTGLVNYHLRKMTLTGIISRLKQQEMRVTYREAPPPLRAVAIGEVAQMFAFIGSAVVLSSVILLIEIKCYMRRKKLKEKNNIVLFKSQNFLNELYGPKKHSVRVQGQYDGYLN